MHDTDAVESVHLSRVISDRGTAVARSSLLIRSTGHLGSPVPDLPFDPATATVPHEAGRVVDPDTGAVVVGWIKRGATGGIGANRVDALETVTTCSPTIAPAACPAQAAERSRGESQERPRVTFATTDAILRRRPR